MKKKGIRWVILFAVFWIASAGFDAYLNHGNANMAADMGNPTLPTVSFETDGYSINLLAGHVNEVGIASMRNTVTPLNQEGDIQLSVNARDRKPSVLTYTVFSGDGKEKLLEKTEKKVEESMTLKIGDVLKDFSEGFLQITLELEDEQKVLYGTRIVRAHDAQFAGCMGFIKNLHSNILNNTNTGDVKKVLETGAGNSGSAPQHVTIYSGLEQVTWNGLKPKVVGEVRCRVQETKSAYTAVQLQYRVLFEGITESKAVYQVKEFFKVRCVDGKYYLLAYDRAILEEFAGGEDSLSSKGIKLGITSSDVQYKGNKEGTIVAFVQANELWSYQKKENEFSVVFSFANNEKEDVRNRFGEHAIRILAMDDDGNITFAVYGYMNRGAHEGESGVAIYYYDMRHNVIKETAFVPSIQSYSQLQQEFGELAYYNSEKDILYVMAGKKLYQIDLQTNEQTVLLQMNDGKDKVSSEDGHLLAYKNPDDDTEAIVLNFKTGEHQSVKVVPGESIRPLGFVRNDFVYGVARTTDSGKTIAGAEVLGMYKLEIRDHKNEVVKTYQEDDVYILDTAFEVNMITLQCATLRDGIYHETAEDYIANNEEAAAGVSMQSYYSEAKGTQYRLAFEDGLKKKRANILRPKHMLFERDTTLEFAKEMDEAKYCVYALGDFIGAYDSAGLALQVAKEKMGLVISPQQRCVWEDGNRVSWYRNFELPAFVAKAGETTLTASLRAVLQYEDVTIDVAAELGAKSAYQVLDENCGGEAILLQGCSSADMRYLIDKGIPVIALTGSTEAVVLVGYDAKTVTYINPKNGGTRSADFESFDKLLSGSGNTFLAYRK